VSYLKQQGQCGYYKWRFLFVSSKYKPAILADILRGFPRAVIIRSQNTPRPASETISLFIIFISLLFCVTHTQLTKVIKQNTKNKSRISDVKGTYESIVHFITVCITAFWNVPS
jgi:hypothetical protein